MSLGDWPFARRMLTHDVNAAVRGARSAGATTVVVKDAHHMCKNLLIDELEPGTHLISGIGSGRDGMMTGVDSSFDAAILVGYHATAGTAGGVLEHALTGGLHRFWINGQIAGEIACSAGVAGAYGMPLVAIASDQAGCAEAAAAIAGISTYATKEGIGKTTALLKHPSETGPGIEKAVAEGLRASIKPYTFDGPVTMRVEFSGTDSADTASTLADVTRLDGYTIELTRPDFLTAHTDLYNVFFLANFGRHADR